MRRTKKIFRGSFRRSYRSGLERYTQDYLTSNGYDFYYEGMKIPYIKKPSTYTPDFHLPNGIIIETKGYFTSEDRSKHLYIKDQHPKLDIRFVFTNPKTRLNKRSKTTYGDWCEKKGFLFAKQDIPKEWLDAPVDEESVEALSEFLKE